MKILSYNKIINYNIIFYFELKKMLKNIVVKKEVLIEKVRIEKFSSKDLFFQILFDYFYFGPDKVVINIYHFVYYGEWKNEKISHKL